MAYYNIACSPGSESHGLLHDRGGLVRFATREEADYEVEVLNWMMSNASPDKRITFTVREAPTTAIHDEGWT